MWCSTGSGSENWKLIFSRSTSLNCITQEVSGHYWPAHKQWLWAKQLGAGHSCVAQQCIVTRGPGSRSTDMLNLTPADPHRAVTVTYTTFFRDTNSHSRFVYWHSLLALIASELVCEHGHLLLQYTHNAKYGGLRSNRKRKLTWPCLNYCILEFLHKTNASCFLAKHFNFISFSSFNLKPRIVCCCLMLPTDFRPFAANVKIPDHY